MPRSTPLARVLLLLAAVLVLRDGAAAQVPQVPKYGPAKAPRAVPLSVDHAYFAGATAPDFWALMPFYVGQMNDAACSVASVAMVVNAAVRAGRPGGNEDQNITQEALLEKVRAEHWKERVSLLGHLGRHGLALSQLAATCEQALRAFGAAGARVSFAAADGTGEGLARFRSALEENERSAHDAILVHFVQDELTDAPGGPYPHISPIGAYDAASKRVLVLDVDRRWYEPYWVADELLWKAMSRSTLPFGAGGWVLARFGN